MALWEDRVFSDLAVRAGDKVFCVHREGREGSCAHSDLTQVMSFGYFGRSKKITSIDNFDTF